MVKRDGGKWWINVNTSNECGDDEKRRKQRESENLGFWAPKSDERGRGNEHEIRANDACVHTVRVLECDVRTATKKTKTKTKRKTRTTTTINAGRNDERVLFSNWFAVFFFFLEDFLGIGLRVRQPVSSRSLSNAVECGESIGKRRLKVRVQRN